MTEKNKQIIDLVEKEYSLNDISSEVGLSNKQIHSRLISLNRIGMNFERKFFYNGDINYKLVKKLTKKEENYEVDLYTSHSDIVFKAMIVSDLHFGNEKNRLDALNAIYDYCITNKIHIVFNTGDLIDGTYGNTQKNYEDVGNQIDNMFKKYPFDKNILNFILLGNHDVSSLKTLGIDMKDFLNNRRPDLVAVGYGRGAINIKNEQIVLRHYVPGFKSDADDSGKLVFLGHNHQTPKYKNTEISDVNFFVGSLSDFNGHCNLPPTAAALSITFYNGYFKEMSLKQLYYVDKKLLQFYEIQKFIGEGKPFMPMKTPALEQDYPSEVQKKLIKS